MNRNQVEKALERLHQASFAWAMRCCFEDKDKAAEVLQEAYLKVLVGKAKYSEKSSFKTWLFAIIRYTAIDHYRKRQNKPISLPESVLEIPVEQDGDESDLDQVLFLKALNSLSRKQSLVLHLVFYQNCTIQEAASIMEIQLGTARTHYERGKNQLRKKLIELGMLNQLKN